MADIQLRFHHDILVLSSPVSTQLERLGVDVSRDNELTLLLEPEILNEVYALEMAAGAQCLVADTAFMAPSRLAHARVKERSEDLAKAALQVVRGSEEYGLTPQHVLVEIGPCGLPLDAASKASLLENRDQYTRATKPFLELEPLFDAYFLNGFVNATDLKCALMGLRKLTDKPVFASVTVGREAEGDAASGPLGVGGMSPLTLGGKGRETLADAVSVMAEYGAQVVGFETAERPEVAVELLREALGACGDALPALVQLHVGEVDPEQENPTDENPYFEPDTMVDAAELLRASGVQFLRATGNATPSYAGALAAVTLGDSVVRTSPGSATGTEEMDDEQAQAFEAQVANRLASGIAANVDELASELAPELDALADRLRSRLNDALGTGEAKGAGGSDAGAGGAGAGDAGTDSADAGDAGAGSADAE